MPRTKPFRILHAEDDEFFAKLCKNEFIEAGHIADHAANGLEALRMLHEEQPDLLILDLIMPHKTGFDVLEEIRSSGRFHDLPIIILSNLAQPSDQEACRKLGVCEYFIKGETSIKDIISYIDTM
ncbi:response regulator [Candidatus Uhrbacteria bacterium]|nr:response regulator [Candidatus Uhrbacteria bacterium]